ncbi:hypothetical protein [Morganella morganii]
MVRLFPALTLLPCAVVCRVAVSDDEELLPYDRFTPKAEPGSP